MRVQREEREKKLGQLPITNNKKYFQSRVLKDLIKEDQKTKAEYQDKKQSLYDRYNKEREYADYVRENYFPLAPHKEEEKDKATAPPAVSAAEKIKMGN